jgi:CspA family cold shock protein
MPIGTIRRFNANKGYGFVEPDSESGPDVFIHISMLARAGIKHPKPGDPLIYEVGERDGRERVVSCEALKSWQTDQA